MAEHRRFTKGLIRPGMAAQLRESVSQAVRESSGLHRPMVVEPLDYETFVVKNKTVLHNDPMRDLLTFPYDDVSATTTSREFRTSISTVPEGAENEATSLFVKECIHTYTSDWQLINFKYKDYSNGYLQLPKTGKVNVILPEHVFEVDEDEEKTGDAGTNSLPRDIGHITKCGWVYRGPDSTTESSFSFTKAYKKRYCYLKQQADTTYALEFHKDDKKLDAKGVIYLDSAADVVKNDKKGRHAFEVHMQDKSVHYLTSDSDQDTEEWINTINKVLQAARAQEQAVNLKDTSSPGRGVDERDGWDSGKNPELLKYSRETDSQLAQARKDGRQDLFHIYPNLPRTPQTKDSCQSSADDFHLKQRSGVRLIVHCGKLTMKLQTSVSEDGKTEKLANPEPFFVRLALYDAKLGQKISEDFHYDPNEAEVRGMIPVDLLRAHDMLNSVDGKSSTGPILKGLKEDWLMFPKAALFSVSNPHSEIYLVARVEKVLQAGVAASAEPYMRTPDPKAALKVHKQMKTYCAHIGHCRMPFAWAARPVFRGKDVDTTHEEFAMYRQESARLSDEDLIKHLQDYRRPEKQSKWQVVHGTLHLKLEPLRQPPPNCVTPSLIPVSPFPSPPKQPITYEVEEFLQEGDIKTAFSYDTYVNNLYVYPRSLKYDSQKSFPKARNIGICMELKDSDEEGSLPLRCIYGQPGSQVYTMSATVAILHHNTTPEFYEEIKIALPTNLTHQHHLLFTFYHVACESAVKSTGRGNTLKKKDIENIIGYAWLPLLKHGRVHVGDQNIRVATSLQPGYMLYEQMGTKGIAGPEIKYVDGARELFRFNLRLVSTIYTKDQHLHNFFYHCQRLESSTQHMVTQDQDTENKLKNGDAENVQTNQDLLNFVKSLHAVDVSTLINFLPTVLNQLFRLLPQTTSEEVALNAVRVLTHIVFEVCDADKGDILHSYVKYLFVTTVPEAKSVLQSKQKTVHEELAKHLTSMLRPTQADQLVINRFLKHSWFFFDVLIKCMAQHLIFTGRIKMPRNERFPSSQQSNFSYRVQTLLQTLVPHIVQKYMDHPIEARNANRALGNFIKRCFTFLDRGFVFRLINLYIENFCPGDSKMLHEFKFDFLRIVCDHEHFIPLNLPMMKSKSRNYKEPGKKRKLKKTKPVVEEIFEDLRHDYTLSEEYRKDHFLVGVLLQEVKNALNEVRDIRKSAIGVLRNLLAKHALDDRYVGKQGRLATLYLPLLMIILENKQRLDIQPDGDQRKDSTAVPNGSGGDEDAHSMKSGTLPSYRSSVSLDPGTPNTSRVNRDSSVFAMIAGGQSTPLSNIDISKPMPVSSSNASLSSSTSSVDQVTGKDSDKKTSDGRTDGKGHQSSPSSAGVQQVMRHDKLDHLEVKDLLLCFLYTVKNLPENALLGWFNNMSEYDTLDFFEVLGMSLHQFKYVGKKRIMALSMIAGSEASKKAMTLPPRQGAKIYQHHRIVSQHYGEDAMTHVPSQSSADAMLKSLMEANMATECGLVILDVISLYSGKFQSQLEFRDGDNAVMNNLFDLYVSFLQTCQSETLLKHAFGALRAFIKKFAKVLFKGRAQMCGRLCYEILRCCNSRLPGIRDEACTLIYLLMRSNFEYMKKKGFTRVHLQIIIAVSQLISDERGLSSTRFQNSLAMVNSYASNDKSVQRTSFPVEVKDLTKRIRTVLMATAQMEEHKNDPEMLVDLQYSLAKSYASTPELRKTWLDSMARIHMTNGDFSEAAHCSIHVAALVAEYLKRRGSYPQGCIAFKNISPNVENEESGIKDDSGMEDVQYSDETLIELLEECAIRFRKAERYELLGEIYRLVIPVYEANRDFERLAETYQTLHESYSKVVEVMHSGKRLLGKFFRVAFFGQNFFEEEDGKEYIYKEPKITGLAEICDRLKKLYSDKFGEGNVKLIQDSNKVDLKELKAKYAYIQVTYVVPFFDESDLKTRQTEFERNNNLRRFMYEIPFTKDKKRAHGSIEEQFKRRVILTTSHSFPYVKKRVLVLYHKEQELNPLEVAVDEMQRKVAELREVTALVRPDMKKLQLKLQGSVSVQVNAGPLAYAQAFLQSGKGAKYSAATLEALRETFREFVCVCGTALELNASLITSDQVEYHESLKVNFKDMVDKLSAIFGEKLLSDEDKTALNLEGQRTSLLVFNAISGNVSSNSSSTHM